MCLSKYKKYYKYIIIALIVCILPVLFLYNRGSIKIDGFSSDNVYETAMELSSSKYNGRRYGTSGNVMAVKYIEDKFKKIGLKPAGDSGTYLREHYENTRTYNGMAVMELKDKNGSIVKKYKYGEDFIEQSFGYSSAGDITSGFSFLHWKGDIDIERPVGNSLVAIVRTDTRDQKTMDTIAHAVGGADYGALITVVPDDYNLRVESSGIGSKPPYKTGYELPSFIITQRLYNELYAYKDKGYNLHLKSTFNTQLVKIYDVLGMIPARSSDYLLIVANLDNVGPASDGTVYPGALDNASGVGALIEIARYIREQDKAPSKNILFIAFNGEDGGLLGSSRYAEQPPYPLYKSTAINIGMVGSKDNVPVSLLYSTVYNYDLDKEVDPSSKLRYHLKNISRKLGIDTSEIKNSDYTHSVFTMAGVPSVSIMEYDKSRARTPDDDMGNVNRANIEKSVRLVMSYIAAFAYPNGNIKGYSIIRQELLVLVKFLYPFIIAVVLLALLLLFMRHMLNTRWKRIKVKFPVLSVAVLVLLMGIVSYMPVKYPYAPSSTPGLMSLVLEGILSFIKSFLIFPIYFMAAFVGVLIMYLAKKRTRSWNYRGDGSELDVIYYISLIVVVAVSFGVTAFYSKPVYYAVTPDFARHIAGKIMLYICLAALAYLVCKLVCKEVDVKNRTLASLVIFSIAFFILLSSFYMPIATNKYILIQNMRGINSGNVYGGK
mgnify:CR=1 FL=1